MSNSSTLQRTASTQMVVGVIVLILGIIAWVWPFSTANEELKAAIPFVGGIILFFWSLAGRQSGFISASTILIALGVSVFLIGSSFEASSDAVKAGVVSLSFGAALLLGAFIPQMWGRKVAFLELIAGAILGVLGVVLITEMIEIGMLDRMASFARFWPVLMIIIGLVLVGRRFR